MWPAFLTAKHTYRPESNRRSAETKFCRRQAAKILRFCIEKPDFYTHIMRTTLNGPDCEHFDYTWGSIFQTCMAEYTVVHPLSKISFGNAFTLKTLVKCSGMLDWNSFQAFHHLHCTPFHALNSFTRNALAALCAQCISDIEHIVRSTFDSHSHHLLPNAFKHIGSCSCKCISGSLQVIVANAFRIIY